MIAAASRRLGYSLIERSLRRTFRRIEWVGDLVPPPAGMPVVLYANHHVFHDSYALGWLLERVLRRTTMVWMAELGRFPFFGALGAMAFPAGDPRRRARSIRATASAFAANPHSALIYYPEGRLHPSEDGVLPIAADQCERLDRVLGSEKRWWPVAVRVTGFHGARPVLQMTAGAPHPSATGIEAARLRGLLDRMAEGGAPTRVLLEGRPGPDERWNFSRAAVPAR